MQAFSKYYKKIYHDFFLILKVLWNIPRMKQFEKQSQRGKCGSCYPICLFLLNDLILSNDM